ncbi:ammonium transporter [Actinomycetospora sp. NBRC 106378]|uniref:ammonium transporter n=1 Tax=Actinomycetospora sp. NBRC 106378 TaxID=3032208 RepID=UPI0024A54617|nr:ammonium transporter [Actinomycetospora sp. NBRC 106378]GLZ53863.1 ammonium transporter [Actinomycetospora sp. NBRC 106378]
MINTGDTAWVLASSALVMLMTPGLAFFYGGMVGARSVLNMLMMVFACLAVVPVLWLLYGYSVAFGSDATELGLFGGLEHAGMRAVIGATVTSAPGHTIPMFAYVMFQLMFAVVTPALIAGAIAARARFGAWMVFVALWSTLVYFPVAHWVFDFSGYASSVSGGPADGGWIANVLKAEDFAGGTAVHINAGAAALALALVLGRREGWPRSAPRPHHVPFILLGASLLWFGWYGFNAGSALAATDTAGLAFTNTTGATAVAVLGWMAIEWLRDGQPTTFGAASGAVAGLVAVTPACAYVNTVGALCIGLAAGVVCAWAVGWKYRLGFDDSLDVVGVHLVGGLIGVLLIGLFGTSSTGTTGAADGLLYGGGLDLLGRQALAAGAVGVYSFLVAGFLGVVISATIGFRVRRDEELAGIDENEHAETAYDLAGLLSDPSRPRSGPPPAGRHASPDGSSNGVGRPDPAALPPWAQ